MWLETAYEIRSITVDSDQQTLAVKAAEIPGLSRRLIAKIRCEDAGGDVSRVRFVMGKDQGRTQRDRHGLR